MLLFVRTNFCSLYMMMSCLSMSATRHSSGVVLCVCVLRCIRSDSMSTVDCHICSTSCESYLSFISNTIELYSNLYYDCKRKINSTVMILKEMNLS